MIEAFDVAAVRAAEERAMADLPEGALMQRAAAGLAVEVVRELRDLIGGVYGRRVVLLVGPGSNGGDALWAGARLLARGVQVTAVLTSGTSTPRAWSRSARGGGRVVEGRRHPGRPRVRCAVPTSRSTGSSGSGAARAA